jgi:hypothetical protein
MIRFTSTDVDRANDAWLCSCGPAALAAICGLTLDEVRPLFPDFRGYTTPTKMFEALRRSGRQWSWTSVMVAEQPPKWPTYGLARIQWHGPWTMPGANQRWAYTHTHWVGVGPLYRADGTTIIPGETCIWDVNQLGDGGVCREEGWAVLAWWIKRTVPRLTAGIRRASGGWSITHAIEVKRP